MYVIYPCSLYQICQIKIIQQKLRIKNDGTDKQQVSLIIKCLCC